MLLDFGDISYVANFESQVTATTSKGLNLDHYTAVVPCFWWLWQAGYSFFQSER